MTIAVSRLRSERNKGKVTVFGEICSGEVRQRRGFQSMVRVCEQITKASAPRGR